MDRVEQLAVIRVDAALAVLDNSVRLPRVEQLVDQVHVLVGHFVTQLARRQRVHAEILGGQILTAGHDVQPKRATGDVVDRGDARASMKGGQPSVDIVGTTPTRDVAAATIAASGTGPCFGTCWAYFSVVSVEPRTLSGTSSLSS